MFETFISNFELGFSFFFAWYNVVSVFVGMFIGIMVGAIPGLTATMAVALLVPITFAMEPVTSLGLLIGVYKGGIYGGSITAILMNTPGTPSAAATALDGYPLAQQGKARKALKMALYSSSIADLLSNLVLILVAAPLATAALLLGPPEMASLLLFALTIVGSVSGSSMLKGLMAAFAGVLFATIGIDRMTGARRFTFGNIELSRGLALIPVLIGLFAIPEVLAYIADRENRRRDAGGELLKADALINLSRDPEDNRVSLKEFARSVPTILRSTGVGTFIGSLPGVGSVVSAFVSYGMAKRASKNPDEYGKGALDGVAAAEAGNNGVTGATLIPLLTLGIPGDTITAVMLGAFLIQGLIPGPRLIQQSPGEVYGLFIALIVSSIAILIVGRIGIDLFVRIANASKSIIFPIVVALCVVGSFAVENSVFDTRVMIFFGVLGYLMRLAAVPAPPFLIAFVLSPLLENSIRQALIIARGSARIFVERPISLALLILTVLSVLLTVVRSQIQRSRRSTTTTIISEEN